jgi:hypothetical protein
MSDIARYIQKNPEETQRLVGVKYEQLVQLIKQAMRKPPLRERLTH